MARREEYKQGDKFQVIGNSIPYHYFDPGEIVEVVRQGGNTVLCVNREGRDQWVNKQDIRPAEGMPRVAKPKTVSLDSVVLPDEKKEEIKAAIHQVGRESVLFEQWGFGSIFEKGTAVSLLFYGTPGTGKTLTAQAIADELDAELKVYGTAEIQSSEPGGAERVMQQIFKEARELFTKEKKRRVILFDECDSLLYDRNKVGAIMSAQINALLTEIEKHDGIIVFTTNRLGTLDPALERRISAKIEFPFPDEAQRVLIWKRMIPKQAPLHKDVSFDDLATYPLAGGNIKNAVLNAARMTLYKDEKTISMERFVQAIEKEMDAVTRFKKPKAKYETGESGFAMNEVQGGQVLQIEEKARAK